MTDQQDPKSTKKTTKSGRVIPFEIIDGGRSDDNEDDFYLDRSRKKAKAADTSPVSKAIQTGASSEAALDAMIQSLALEEGKLLYEQEQEEKRGYLDLDIIDRRVNIIGKMMNGVLKRRAQASKRGLDLHSPQFRLALSSFLDIIRESMEEEGTGHGKIEAFMVRIANKMEAWETRLQHQLNGE